MNKKISFFLFSRARLSHTPLRCSLIYRQFTLQWNLVTSYIRFTWSNQLFQVQRVLFWDSHNFATTNYAPKTVLIGGFMWVRLIARVFWLPMWWYRKFEDTQLELITLSNNIYQVTNEPTQIISSFSSINFISVIRQTWSQNVESTLRSTITVSAR